MALLSKMLADWRHSMIAPYIKGDVLDIACGDSIVLQKFAEHIDSYCGVEFHLKGFEKLSEDFPEVLFLKKDLDKELLNIETRFDVILMIAIIEHIWNQKFLFDQLVSLLKPDGKIVITTPTPFGNDVVHTAGAKVGFFAKSAVNDHIVIYNRKRFEILAHEFGLTILKYKRFQLYSNQLVVLGVNSSPE